MNPGEFANAIKQYARQLGFTLAGITTPQLPGHFDVYRRWVDASYHAEMAYLADERAIEQRADPRMILPECQSILVLGIPYTNPQAEPPLNESSPHGKIAAYAWGDDYHLVLPARLAAIVGFIEKQMGHSIPNRWYTDTGPVLERDLAQRAGLGWIGKNTCLISPKHGSYFLLAEILLGIALPPDALFATDHCGACTRCVDACPTHCILPNRTIDARQCISYLTIENKAEIPLELRPKLQNWVFGCDICQMVCPWNIRFAHQAGDPVFAAHAGIPLPILTSEMELTPQEFNRKFKTSPVKRAKRRGYLRNLAVAAGNVGGAELLPALENAQMDDEPLVRQHTEWAAAQIKKRVK
jgi:epoxyqueuosine reductase